MSPRTPRSSDELRTRSDDPDAPPGPKSARPGRSSSDPFDSRTTDEISAMLSSSMELPQPDPMLGGSSSWDLERAAAQDSPGAAPRLRSADGLDIGVETAPRHAAAGPRREREEGASWTSVILKSYASAVTLALAWLLWSGRTTPKAVPAREAPAPRRPAVEPTAPTASSAAVADVPAGRLTSLGKPIVVGDLEITPLMVLHRSVRTSRNLGEENLVRDHDGCLALTLRLKNLATEDSLQPLAAEDLRDGEAFAIDAPPAGRIGMFALAAGSAWTIEEQQFPTLDPGAVEDVVLVSEPIPAERLGPAMTWRFRVAADAGRTERADVGVRFGRDQVHGDGG
ncbi:hypothetical protein [Paludisphaera mucosa]|uniref:DUF4352 domain-containing protein n=1 Tax=Paludisphaera mucosa TaxID=3030827 RepID=A0ABT6F993_9BACT|nr:hypothetical protein [Paludisphaera mucosa]MDG3004162.1 hypothetical protein [Paludisphaera mucosa]